MTRIEPILGSQDSLSMDSTKKVAAREAKQLVLRVAEKQQVTPSEAAKALATSWVGKWCPALPENFRGKAESICDARELLEKLSREADIPLDQLLEAALKVP